MAKSLRLKNFYSKKFILTTYTLIESVENVNDAKIVHILKFVKFYIIFWQICKIQSYYLKSLKSTNENGKFTIIYSKKFRPDRKCMFLSATHIALKCYLLKNGFEKN